MKSDQLDKLLPLDTNLIVLAGYMPIISSKICAKWKGKLINTHPSLLPRYGGIGMYGVKVQEAVMAAKEIYGGCSVHYVSEKVDMGDLIRQKSIKINYEETPWQLGGHINKLERDLIVEVSMFLKSKCITS
ncbi:phosphoribosylglycinamide formyltransferase [Prochlorococcus marinus str. NATL2A]|uniref:phosphoribosylglycinamide formyltransferase 1 n=1 Tax=Prochlorococcus marinus (strain NATL2A) TaxID=59920 RepID=Q46JL6_PROMT|nr:formyltransferase family protein [Prochlorococcus marinus]AAZ58312.1 phosphoribosylglycinamide formyltransferase [Prochlorococcus marinus str. NATL2A]